MLFFRILFEIIGSAVIFFLANYETMKIYTGDKAYLYPVLLFVFFILNIIPSPANFVVRKTKLRICADGCELLILFVISCGSAVLYYITHIFLGDIDAASPTIRDMWIKNTVSVILIENIVFLH